MAVANVENLPLLLAVGALSMLLVNPIYSRLASKTNLKKLLIYCYSFFIFNLLGFLFAWKVLDLEGVVWLGRAFYAKETYPEAKATFVQFQHENPLHPKFANSMYELAQTLVELGEVEAAKMMLSEMLDKFPTHSLRMKAESKLQVLQELTAES